MPNNTCREDGCEARTASRNLCARHYGLQYRNGTLPGRPPVTRHVLSNVDTEARTATCSVCGLTRVSIRRGRNECMTVRQRHIEGYKRGEKLRAKYGISVADFEAMEGSQCGKCAICSCMPGALVVDHDHATGGVRQLLCGHCNTALGFLRDNPNIALSAAAYLISHSTS